MSKQELSACRVVWAGKTVKGKQELFYNVGVSAESAGAHGIRCTDISAGVPWLGGARG
ncbi:MAG: hypothetical protein QOG73_1713 [Acetobacteraceae bacterium]|jgi:hypothetical protein|nr:hypothetical protein [Acetobacteraceae bacterium]